LPQNNPLKEELILREKQENTDEKIPNESSINNQEVNTKEEIKESKKDNTSKTSDEKSNKR
jgi:hypothetical protein